MTKVFSFCIYGNNYKYTQGLLENIEMIQEFYPDFQVWIAGGNDVPSEYIQKYNSYPSVKYFSYDLTGGELMTYRFFFLDHDEIEIFFVRDADSRIDERDRWSINQFLNSDSKFHIIRDHYHHRRLIMGAMWGIKKTENLNLENNYQIWKDKNKNIIGTYRSDQDFIDEYIYPKYLGKMLIHSNLIGFKGEKVSPIEIKMKDDKDFVGNVYEYNQDKQKYLAFSYNDFNYYKLALWLATQDQNQLSESVLSLIS